MSVLWEVATGSEMRNLLDLFVGSMKLGIAAGLGFFFILIFAAGVVKVWRGIQ